MTNIRWVITQTGVLTERVATLKESLEKLGPAIEKASDRQSRELREAMERLGADMKERFERAERPVAELRSDMKDVKAELKESIRKWLSFAERCGP